MGHSGLDHLVIASFHDRLDDGWYQVACMGYASVRSWTDGPQELLSSTALKAVALQPAE